MERWRLKVEGPATGDQSTLRMPRKVRGATGARSRGDAMMIVEFDCPHCGNELEATPDMDGQTHACPNCNRLVTLQVITTKQALKAGIVAGGLAALAAIIFGGDNS